jgi:site-specific DNA recombinase
MSVPRPEPCQRRSTRAPWLAEAPGPGPAVVYTAKSTEDKRGSIQTQLADCRALAEREGREVVGEFSDEGFSAYSGNRGPGLEHARRAVAEAAPSVLMAQHSDRLARGAGDAPGASQHLSEVIDWAIRSRVTIRTVQDDFYADPRTARLMAAAMGQRNFEDSERKSRAVKNGLRNRKERGAPVGPVPLGYRVEKDVIEEKVTTSRVVDAATAPVVERIFDLIEAGATFGAIARRLNAEGVTGRRGKPWISRTVRKIVHNRAYVGEKGYPAIIDARRFDAIHARLSRLDPAQVAKRRGGRKPRDDSYFLRGIAFCGSCGAAMYTRLQRGKRVYVCANRREGTGLCSAPVIPAELIESHVLRHLDSFVGSVEGWLAERVDERRRERRERERALERQRAELGELDRVRDRHLAVYRKLVTEGARTAYVALEEVERIDRERNEREQAIQQAEAVVSEWAGPPDVDAALDYYSALVDHVQGQIRNTDGARELNDALSTVVAGLWCEIEMDRERLLVEFELVGEFEHVLPGGVPSLPELRRRPTLPPRHLDDERMGTELLAEMEAARRQTGTQTKVNRSLAEGRARLRRLGPGYASSDT